MSGSSYDFIIAGAGMAGLSLAYRLPRDAKVLLIDRERKTRNDRTWCFWEAGDGPFEAAIHRRWDDIWVHGPNLSERFTIAPYRYKMLRGADFYQYVNTWLEPQPNITVKYGHLERLESDTSSATAWVDGAAHRSSWAFNSAFIPEVARSGFHHLLQHFKGWIVRTVEARFDPSAATFMDFRTPQHGDVRFVYVLPLDERTALVEYTLFSPALLPESGYDDALKNYLREHLRLEQFEILETEFGVIPMTDAPFPRMHSPRVMNIGIAGGRAKASTGYTFQRAQRQAQTIAHAILETGSPVHHTPAFNRHDWMDSVYLNVLDKKRESGSRFFTELFRHNDAVQVLKFLDEGSSLLEDLRLMTTVNIPAFTAAALEVSARRVAEAWRSRAGTSPVPTRAGKRG
jgi:lycopene beta-cyclase